MSESVEAADLTFLRSVDSPTIANAIELLGLRDRTEGFIGGRVRSLYPDRPPTVGLALTVAAKNAPGPGVGMAGFWAMMDALDQMPAPSVIVAQDRSATPGRYACSGDVMASVAGRLGAVGFVTDGLVRDIDQVRPLGFALFAAGLCVSHANFWLDEVGAEVEIAGQSIRTGDLLHGDANGIVVVPRQALPGLPEAVRRVREKEGELMTFARSPAFSLEEAKRLTGYR
ncbi:MAG: RraA family protein [Chloroflexia bacterium]|nr:RraA family protein [Chloroflexia bacterium]